MRFVTHRSFPARVPRGGQDAVGDAEEPPAKGQVLAHVDDPHREVLIERLLVVKYDKHEEPKDYWQGCAGDHANEHAVHHGLGGGSGGGLSRGGGGGGTFPTPAVASSGVRFAHLRLGRPLSCGLGLIRSCILCRNRGLLLLLLL